MSLLASLLQQPLDARKRKMRNTYISPWMREAQKIALHTRAIETFRAVMQGKGALSSSYMASVLKRSPSSVNASLKNVLIPEGVVKLAYKQGGSTRKGGNPAFYYKWIEESE